MRSAFAAEWRKLLGHTKAIAFLVWVYPIGALMIVLLIQILPALLLDPVREMIAASPIDWTENLLSVWNAMNGFPGGTFLRMPFIAFIAMAFAGEYQWGTWKNIVPRQSRMNLIFAKFLVLALLLMLALLLTSLVLLAGGWLESVLFNVPYGPSLAELDWGAFLQQALLQVLVTFVSTLIVASYAALIAMYSRSIIASLLLSVGVGIVELTSSVLLVIVSQAVQRPNLVNILVALPTYNLDNVRSWVVDGVGSTFGGYPGFTAVPPLWLSMVILLLWLGGLVGGTAVLFRHQDITS
ncbi:MAG: ABC transporter permease [Ardenticatenaceae bacterium]|nr:ABC transporter permease [Ardenticatenaceae bacterium]